jgi:RNA polymerase sigma-70 factor (ECF subfamily)
MAKKAGRLGERERETEAAMSPPLETFEDSVLIQLTLAGRSECFDVLMDRHMGAVRKRVHSIVRNPTDAEDALQEAVLKVWRCLSTFRSESSFRTWMSRVAINEALQSCRQDRRRRVCQPLGDADFFVSPGELQDEALIRAETTRTVRSAVVGLPPKYRQVLILRDLQDLSTRETAQRLHSTIPAVKTQLFRGRGMLLAAIQRSGARELAA